jgi:hypothetical protein
MTDALDLQDFKRATDAGWTGRFACVRRGVEPQRACGLVYVGIRFRRKRRLRAADSNPNDAQVSDLKSL